MFSTFFINRPIFATVLSILIVIAGLVSLRGLPVEQYPTITPPTVVVRASYPGANASTIADMVGTPIEQQVNGVEGMLYMSSTSSSTGSYQLTITFEVGTDLDMATVLVEKPGEHGPEHFTAGGDPDRGHYDQGIDQRRDVSVTDLG